MKQFNLQEYLKNPNKKIITRDGNDARIICTDRVAVQPIVALVQTKDRESLFTYTTNGKYDVAETATDLDLFFVTEKKEGWMNLYKSCKKIIGGFVYNSEEAAKGEIAENKLYIATIKIEWEE